MGSSEKFARGIAPALLTGLVACGEGPPDRPIVYRGDYHYDAVSAYLVQPGVAAKICIQDNDMKPAIQPEFVAAGGISEVVVRGQLSKPGKYGHEDVCTYLLTRSELLGVGERREREDR